MNLPFVTAELAGTGGVLRAGEDDFIVDEEPAYAPSGAGDHVFARIEKRGLTTPAAVTLIARALGVRERDIGVAGLKDRRAVTRQWISLPPPLTPEAVRPLALDGVRVLEAARHGHKLRTGHLRANRFALRIRDLAVDAGEAAARARAILDRLAEPPGAPNWFGEQRFGRDGDNAARGRALIAAASAARTGARGRREPSEAIERGSEAIERGSDAIDGGNPAGSAGEARGKPPDRMTRFMVSALQSELFNAWLCARLADGHYRAALAGDILHKRGGGLFECTDPELDSARLAAGELVATGPMFGARMRRPADGSPAAAREDAVLAAAGLDRDAFAGVRAIAEGTRRDAAIAIADVAIAAGRDGTLEVAFALPAGGYATTVIREVMKRDAARPDPAPARDT